MLGIIEAHVRRQQRIVPPAEAADDAAETRTLRRFREAGVDLFELMLHRLDELGTVRTRASLSAMRACIGMCSQMSKPETFDLIGLNSPRMSAGAFGFRSYMSMWLAPREKRRAMLTEIGRD
jgi:hypothetical protein